ncbi:hypothetical protein HNY73_020292 [Argiope bruennichi]|uniref:Uncharacterized protein n=1 Tax=Argiope bruennichi TaxID=94029 RepID=A0A8T0E8V5_ARGBR|nr:hypothetical protein HNY73_020292 [Argiope bruennichi]
MTVRYIADANGYRAEIFKDEADSLGKHVGINAERKDGRVLISYWAVRSTVGVALKLYTPGKDSKGGRR